MPRQSLLRGTTLALALLICAHTAHAADGVREINQTCATQGGCFSGDAAGFPVTISSAGSYRLTSNLTTGSRNVSAIVVATRDASIDLGGFTIACAFGLIVPVGCTSGTTGSGVVVSGSGARLRVHDGVIQGMGAAGVVAGAQAHIEGLRIANNGSDGIRAGGGSLVAGNLIRSNGGFGIVGPPPFTSAVGYRDNVISGNSQGTVGGSQVNMGGNVCNGNLSCP